MKHLLNVIFLTSVLTVAPAAVAAPSWSNYLTLTNVEVSNGNLYVMAPDLATCKGTGSIQLTDGNGSREIFSMAMSAFLAQKKVKLLLDGCNTSYVIKGITF